MATPPTFTAGSVLTAAQMNAAGLWLVKTQTIGTAVSTVTVSNAFSADYDNYLITIAGGSGSATANLSLKLGASATGYYSARNGITYSTGARSDGVDNNAAAWTAVGVSETNGIYASISLSGPFLSKYTYLSCGYDNGTAGVVVFGSHKIATSYTDFTLTPSTGTLTGGTIRVYGIRN